MQIYERAKSAIKDGHDDEAIKLFTQAIPLLREQGETLKTCEAYIELGGLLERKNLTNEAIKHLQTAKRVLEEGQIVDTVLYGVCLLNLSGSLYKKRQVEESLKLDKQAIILLEKINHDKSQIAILLNNLGLTLEIAGEYEQAILQIQKALQLQMEVFGLYDKDTADSYYHLGFVLMNAAQYSVALNHFKKSLTIIKDIQKNGNFVGTQRFIKVYQRIAYSYQQINEPDSSFRYIQLALDLQAPDNAFRKYLSYELFSENMVREGSFSIGISSAKIALDLVKVEYKNFDRHPVIARQYTHLGEIYQANNQLDSAVHYFHQGVIYLAHGFENQIIYSNPTVEQCFLEYDIIRSLRGKAKALYLRYQESKDLRDLKASLDSYQLTHDFIKKLKEDITTMGSKQRLAGDALEIYEEAIQAALALHEVTGEDQYLEKALFFAESNKAILLLESMNERMAQSVSGIPDSLLEKERQFRVDISYYEREINEENNKKSGVPDQEKIKEWDDKLYTLRREYQQLIDQFEDEYPKYYRLKYDTKLATVQDIRKEMIDGKTAFLEYFVGVEKIYLFEITKRDFKVHRLEKSADFEENIREIQRMAKKPQLSTEEIPDFQKRIFSIYQQYAASAIEHLPSKIRRLLIVPDDMLNLIPFELLSTDEDALNFMIKDYTISYAYSASLSMASQKPGGIVADQLFLGYAPTFSAPIAENRSCAGDQLANLENSSREVVGIQALLGGNVMLGTDANRDSFLAQAGHYRIIHLATHACMDEENPMQSKVFFADEPIVNQDLFNLNLSADLAVLSACNTGSGQLVKGDGVLSLSKGFVHAGCPSAVMSLWSVDDFSTSEIMIDFYDYLKKGYEKDSALRQAKLDFIATADKVKKHPFFWAAFVQMGDPVALDLGQAGFPWQIILIVGALALIGGFLLRRRAVSAA